VKRLPVTSIPVIAVILGIPKVLFPGTVLAQVSYTCAFAVFVALAWAGVRAQTGRARLAHGLIAGALTSWLAGDLLYAVLSWIRPDLGSVSAADVLWVAGYPLQAAGLVVLARMRAPGKLREGLLDGLAMATVVGSLAWQLIVLPAFATEGFSLPLLFDGFYPSGDVLLFVAAAMLAFSPGDRRGPSRYLISAVLLTLVGDASNSAIEIFAPAWDSERLDAVLLLANGLIAAALYHPQAERLSRSHAHEEQRLHPARVAFLGVALLAMPALADLGVFGTGFSRLSLLISMVILTGIVLIRFALVVREQERARRALAERATHDPLTGLVNRQELHARITSALAGADSPAVYFLDLNGFKPINDGYGHAAGDFVLTEVARRLRAETRAGDTVGRLGGDEFVVVTHDADEGLTARLRDVVAAPIAYGDLVLAVGVSVGRACAADLPGPTADGLLAAADADMYREKAGHHRLIHSS
jgi:diguanylate cyclase (GGDEF)-like protein